MLHKIHQKTKVNANVGNKKEKKTFIIWVENKEDDLESILSFDSEMSSIYSENDNSSSESDLE